MIDSAPAPSRASQGWTFRFVAEGKRAEEMVDLYRALGFDVTADPVTVEVEGASVQECDACRELAAERHLAIYTRLPARDSEPDHSHGTDPGPPESSDDT